MNCRIVEVNPWKSFLHEKFIGKTERMQSRFVMARLNLGFLLFTCLGLLPIVSQAAGVASVAVKSTATRPYEFKGLSVGVVSGYIDYKEPGYMREYGQLYGLNVGYSVLDETTTLAFNVEGQLVAGRLLYDGADVNLDTGVTTPKTSPTDDYIYNIRGTIGTYREINSLFAITPYAGLGVRVLNDKIIGSGSYNRNVSYIYLPIGVMFAGWFNDSWSYSLAGDLDFVVFGTVISKFSDVNPSNPDITNHNRGTGARLQTSIRRNFSRFAIHAGVFYQKWKMDQSDGVSVTINNKPGSLIEPTNESDFAGLDIGMDF